MSTNWMNLLSGGLVESIGKIVDDVHTSGEEILDKENEIKKAEMNHIIELKSLDIARENETTDRWESDANSDSRIAKMTRPILVMYLIIAVTILALLDGNYDNFIIKNSWIDLFTTLSITALGGYFTLRTYEKRTGTNKWS